MITLYSKWSDFDTPQKWRRWLDIAAKEAPDIAAYWDTDEGCNGCIYFDSKNVWCNLCEAPATRNPILNMIGMACCGAGKCYKGNHNRPFFPLTAENSG